MRPRSRNRLKSQDSEDRQNLRCCNDDIDKKGFGSTVKNRIARGVNLHTSRGRRSLVIGAELMIPIVH